MYSMVNAAKNPANASSSFRRVHSVGAALVSLIPDHDMRLQIVPVDSRGQQFRTTTVMFSEPELYNMLLKGHAPQSEPFRK